jgi:hypothetical protein
VLIIAKSRSPSKPAKSLATTSITLPLVTKASRVKRKAKEPLSLVVQLVYSKGAEIAGKIRDIVEIRSTQGRMIKLTAKHIIKKR